MGKVVLGTIAGFLVWLVVWIGGEMVLSAIWPEWYGAHQRAFTAAIKTGSSFAADATILVIHVVFATFIAMLAGFVAAWIARGNKRAPLALGVLLLALGILKAAMSWPLVPIWYHLAFTAVLLPMAIVGGRWVPAK